MRFLRHDKCAAGLRRVRMGAGKALLASFALVAGLLAVPGAALAESYEGQGQWRVTYTADGKMQDNYSTREYADQVSQLQPGDDITFTVALYQENATAADWYMANEVIQSLEDADADAAGSSYEYLLTYTSPSGAVSTLYDSTVVGGDDEAGLHGADSALSDYFYLDNLSSGQSASVSLRVALDGETEGNAYFDTLGRLKLKFAVEPNVQDTPGSSNTPTTQRRSIVRTGDEQRLFPFYVAMVVSGLLFLALAVQGVRERRREREEAGR